MAPDPETCKPDNSGGRMKGILTKGYPGRSDLSRNYIDWPSTFRVLLA